MQTKEYNIKFAKFEDIVFFNNEGTSKAARDIISGKNNKGKVFDENGIIMQIQRDGSISYNPLRIAAGATQLLLFYLTQSDYTLPETLEEFNDKEDYLDGVLKILMKYVDFIRDGDHIPAEGVRLYPYNFDFALHANKEETMYAPWYSGLAQAQMLILASQLGRLFGKKYDEWCLELCESLVVPPCGVLDKDGYYWIDEYPNDKVFDGTLNGHICGLMALQLYYAKIKDPEVKRFLDAGIYTVEHYANEFRNPGNACYYCLAHKTPCDKANFKYHVCHIKQFDWLYQITGDVFFKKFSGDLTKDLKKARKKLETK